ncbi:MAG: methylenetetrahydrofolate--tRNA-(uracil(54)-C(5))-methyltransferase (FADH(2)-oxidizing) TrmFO, partial [Clostridia bacterium]|nr:methylenetetrahydrofolate--tRNA-(uracil(54)-C(5))-methyltransferase (FADH(2)-oxidizing) TrmFO [Clostridia bacterium]
IIKNKKQVVFPKETMIGSLSDYISSENANFQPMNANFGILPELDRKIKDKKERYEELSKKSLNKLDIIIDKL